MAQNKTKRTSASVEDYIASRASAHQAADCHDVMTMCERITGQPPHMWGPSIVGFDSYRYTYESGHSGEAPVVGFAIRGRDLVIYLSADSAEQHALLARLGKHKMGKSCLYFRQLADLHQPTLEQLVVNSIADIRQRHG